MFDMEMLGMNIRHLRKVRGMTQEELAKRAGLSTMSIRRYENGERIVTEKTMARIANALDVAIYEFFPDGEEMDKELFPWWPLHPPHKLSGIEAKNYVKNRFANAETWKARKDEIGEDLAKLNDDGQIEAVKRVKELTRLDEYRRKPESSPLSAGIKVYGDGPAGSFTPAPEPGTPSEASQAAPEPPPPPGWQNTTPPPPDAAEGPEKPGEGG